MLSFYIKNTNGQHWAIATAERNATSINEGDSIILPFNQEDAKAFMREGQDLTVSFGPDKQLTVRDFFALDNVELSFADNTLDPSILQDQMSVQLQITETLHAPRYVQVTPGSVVESEYGNTYHLPQYQESNVALASEGSESLLVSDSAGNHLLTFENFFQELHSVLLPPQIMIGEQAVDAETLDFINAAEAGGRLEMVPFAKVTTSDQFEYNFTAHSKGDESLSVSVLTPEGETPEWLEVRDLGENQFQLVGTPPNDTGTMQPFVISVVDTITNNTVESQNILFLINKVEHETQEGGAISGADVMVVDEYGPATGTDSTTTNINMISRFNLVMPAVSSVTIGSLVKQTNAELEFGQEQSIYYKGLKLGEGGAAKAVGTQTTQVQTAADVSANVQTISEASQNREVQRDKDQEADREPQGAGDELDKSTNVDSDSLIQDLNIDQALGTQALSKQQINQFIEQAKEALLEKLREQNHNPNLKNDTLTIGEDGSPTVIDVLANDSDIDPNDANALVITDVSFNANQSATGELTIIDNGKKVQFDPLQEFQFLDKNESLEVFATYTVTDGTASAKATIGILVTGENDPPVANEDTVTKTEDFSSFSTDVGANDFDPDDPIELSSINTSTDTKTANFENTDISLTVSQVTGTNKIKLDPVSDLDALDTGESKTFVYNYTVTDDNGESDSADYKVTIEGVNDAPNASDDSLSADEQLNTNSIDLANNDTDPDDDIDAATVTLDADGDADDVITVGDSSITVTDNGNADSQITATSFTPSFDASLSGTGNSTVSLSSTGSDLDLLDKDDTLTFSIDYTIDDGEATGQATLDVTINGENDAPVASSDSDSEAEDTLLGSTLSEDLGSNDSDVDDDINVSSIDNNNGTATATADIGTTMTLVKDSLSGNTITVSPDSNDTVTLEDGTQDGLTVNALNALASGESKTFTFNYTVTDDNNASDSSIYDVTVTGDNDDPVIAQNSTFSKAENNNTLSKNMVDEAGDDVDDTDSDLDVNSVVSASDSTTQTVSLTSDVGTTVSITAAINNSDNDIIDFSASNLNALDDVDGTKTFSYTYDIKDDDGGTSGQKTIDIDVTGENDAPTAGDTTFSDPQSENFSTFTKDLVSLEGSDVDDTASQLDVSTVDNSDSFTASYNNTTVSISTSITGSSNDQIEFSRDSSFDVLDTDDDADNDGNIEFQFDYKLKDDNGAESTSKTITVEVPVANDAPVASSDSDSSGEDALIGSSLSEDLGSNDTDPDDDIDVTSADGSATATANIGTTMTLVKDSLSNNTITVSPDSNDTVTLADGSTVNALNALDSGESKTFSFNYTVTDDNNASDTSTYDVTVTGDNDAPIAISDDITESTTETEDNFDGYTSDLIANDDDVDDPLSELDIAEISSGNSTVSTENSELELVNSTESAGGQDITFDIDFSGDSVTVIEDDDNSFNALDALQEGSHTFSFNYKTVDDDGANSTENTVSFSIDGVNDQPDMPNAGSNSPYTINGEETIDTIIPDEDIIDIDNGTNTDGDRQLEGDNNHIAVTNVENGGGTWQYQDGDGNWQDIQVGTDEAFLLNESDKIRLNGTSDNTEELQFHAWDQTDGNSHFSTITLDTGTIGNTDPFSDNSALITP